MRVRTRSLGAGLLAGSAFALIVAVAPATAAPAAPASLANARFSAEAVHGEVLGAAARAATQGQTAAYLADHGLRPRTSLATTPNADPQKIVADQGIGFTEDNDTGAMATQSVTTTLRPANADTQIFTPTLHPTGGTCVDVATAYTATTQAVEAFDYCNHIDFEASVPIDAAFLSRYTNGTGSYTVQIKQTDAAANTWTAYLYDYTAGAFETFYSSSGTPILTGTYGGDDDQLSSDLQSNGQSYACADMANRTFSSSGIQLYLSGVWTPATPDNSILGAINQNEFHCAARQFQVISAYDHWQVQD